MGAIAKGIKYNNDNTLPEGFNKGTVYLKVHFRMNTSTYRDKNYNIGFNRDTDRDGFYSEMHEFLSCHGFIKPDHRFGSTVCKDEYSKLHLHPDDISGMVKEDLLHSLQSAFEEKEGGCKYSGWTDVYRAYEVVDEDEVKHRVSISATEIEDILFEKLKTKRKDRFFVAPAWRNYVANLKGFNFIEGKYHHDLLDDLVGSIVNTMVSKGTLKKQFDDKGTVYYRSANKAEMAKLVKKVKPVVHSEDQGALFA